MELFKRGPATGTRLMVLVVLGLLLMAIDRHEQHAKFIHKALSVMMSPIQYAVDAPFRWSRSFSQRVSSQQHLLSENTEFRRQLLLLQGQNQQLATLTKENQQLHALFKSKAKLSDDVVAARLLSVATTPYMQQFTLAKGEHDKVFVGQVVLDANGVIGQVTRVGLNTSQVLLATDSRSAIPVESLRNGLRGVLIGRGSNTSLRLLYVPKSAEISVGDEFITSGLGQRFPRGYPVGVVSNVSDRPSEHFKTIDIKPHGKFLQNNLVLLVVPKAHKKMSKHAKPTTK